MSGEERRNLLLRLLREREQAGVFEYPLSDSQRGLWFFYRAAPGNPAYNTGAALRFTPRLNAGAFEMAAQAVVQAHDSLRTVFRAADEYPVQRVLNTFRIPIERVQAGGWPEALLIERLRAARELPFDLAAAPPIRVHVFEREQEGEDVVLISVHHIVCDGWSFGILLDQLREYYEQALRQGRVEARRQAACYRDCVAAQAAYLASPEAAEALAFWGSYLRPPTPALVLPYDFEREAAGRFRGAAVPIRLEEELATRLRKLAASESTTLYTALLSVYAMLLRSVTGGREFNVGMPVAGRDESRFTGVIGCFINVAPVRITLNPEWSCRDLIGAVKKQMLAAMRHSRYPFSRIVERLRLGGDPGRRAVYQTTFNLFHAHAEVGQDDIDILTAGGATRFGDSRAAVIPIGQQEGLFELAMDMADSGGCLVGQLSYDASLFRKETACLLRDRYLGMLERLAETPDHAIAEGPAAERDQMEL